MTGDLTVQGNTTFGDAAPDTVNFIATIASSFVPNANATYDLGSSSLYWNNAYINNLVATSATIGGSDVLTTSTTFANAATSDIDVSGTYNSLDLQIKADVVGSSEIADGSVASTDIADGTITDADISATAAISASKISEVWIDESGDTMAGVLDFNATSGIFVLPATDAAGAGRIRYDSGTTTVQYHDGTSWITLWGEGNDGAGSGLDADLLDGNTSSFYLDTSATAQTKAGDLTISADFIVNGQSTIGASGTGISAIIHGTVNVDPPSIPGSTSATFTVTITGATVGDRIFLTPPDTIEGELVYQGAAVTAADTVTIRLYNWTAGAVDGAALTWSYLIIRP
jgi:hypothetical protein